MKVFFDTSSLIKLYQEEPGTNEFLQAVDVSRIYRIYISPITRIEFHSAVYKKVRTSEISEALAFQLIDLFESDCTYFQIVPYSEELLTEALSFLKRYRVEGLRTQDSIQLASAVACKKEINLAASNDKLLLTFSQKEGIKTN